MSVGYLRTLDEEASDRASANKRIRALAREAGQAAGDGTEFDSSGDDSSYTDKTIIWSWRDREQSWNLQAWVGRVVKRHNIYTYKPLNGHHFGEPTLEDSQAIKKTKADHRLLQFFHRYAEHLYFGITQMKARDLLSPDFFVVDVGVHLIASQLEKHKCCGVDVDYALEFTMMGQGVLAYKPNIPVSQLQQSNGLYSKVEEGKYVNARKCTLERRIHHTGSGIWQLVLPQPAPTSADTAQPRESIQGFYARSCATHDGSVPPSGFWFHESQQFFVGVHQACPANMWMSLYWDCLLELIELQSHEEQDRIETFKGIAASSWNVCDLAIFTTWTLVYLPHVEDLDYSAFLTICSGVSLSGSILLSHGLADMCIENAPTVMVRQIAACLTAGSTAAGVFLLYAMTSHLWFPKQPIAVIHGWRWMIVSCSCSCLFCSAPLSTFLGKNSFAGRPMSIFERERIEAEFFRRNDWTVQTIERCIIGILVFFVRGLSSNTLTITADNVIGYILLGVLVSVLNLHCLMEPETLTLQCFVSIFGEEGFGKQSEPLPSFKTVTMRILLRHSCLVAVAYGFIHHCSLYKLKLTRSTEPTLLFIAIFLLLIAISGCKSFFRVRQSKDGDSWWSIWPEALAYAKHQQDTFLMQCLQMGMPDGDLTKTQECLFALQQCLQNTWVAVLMARQRRDVIRSAKISHMKHTVLELCYDIAQVVVMAWVESNVSLTQSRFRFKLIMDFLNWLSTLVDLLVLKGPKILARTGGQPQEVLASLSSTVEDMDAEADAEAGKGDVVEFPLFDNPRESTQEHFKVAKTMLSEDPGIDQPQPRTYTIAGVHDSRRRSWEKD